MSGGAVIELQQVARSFDGGRSFAVDGVDLTVGDGEFLALVGT